MRQTILPMVASLLLPMPALAHLPVSDPAPAREPATPAESRLPPAPASELTTDRPSPTDTAPTPADTAPTPADTAPAPEEVAPILPSPLDNESTEPRAPDQAPTSAEPAVGAPLSTPPPASGPAATASVRVQGRVREAGTRLPLEGIEIKGPCIDTEVYSDENGKFELFLSAPGACTLQFEAPDYARHSLPLLTTRGQVLSVDVYLKPAAQARRFAMTVETQRTPEDQVTYDLDAAEAAKAPGSLGDPLRSVMNLPGVAHAPYGLGALIIRGTAPYESGYFIDGTAVPLIFHFMGIISAVSPNLIETIDYLPGGFGVRYGRLVGGAVALNLKEEMPSGIHGHTDVDVLDASAHLQGRSGPVSYTAAARASYLEKYLTPISDQLLNYPLQAAHYADAQLRLMARLSPNTNASLMWMTSQDRFLLLGETADGATDVDPEALAEYQSDFSRIQFHLNSQFSGPDKASATITHQLTLAAGPNHEKLNYGSTELEFFPTIVALRDEWKVGWSSAFAMRAGLDIEATGHRFTIDYPGQDADIPEEQKGWSYAPATYLELDWQSRAGLRIQPGLRWDLYWNPSQDFITWSIDPRVAFFRPLSLSDLALNSDSAPRKQSLALSWSIGEYSQPPDATEYFKQYGNSQLQMYHALQLGAGAQYRLEPGWSAQLNLFFSFLRDVVYLPDAEPIPIEDFILGTADTSALRPIPQNGGIGASFGSELRLQSPSFHRLSGSLALSLSKSLRLNPGDQVWSTFDYDQPLSLTLMGMYELGHGWTSGLRFKLNSGSPYSSVTNRLQNIDTGGYSPLDDPTVGDNNARMPLFHTLDLRIDKRWTFNTWKMSASLEVQNVYNRQNVELVYPNRDYSDVVPIYGLPFLPVLGVGGEF